MQTAFRKRLLAWYEANHRKLPWRETQDPYAIWISEVMLQQTRVAFVLGYYQRFLERFPTITSLAEASEHDLLQAWAGLGYYSRARNLQRAAKRSQSSFPKDYESIRVLPGIGDYTAAAIASIAFNQPYAAVDGNVLRVLSRLHNDPTNLVQKKHYQAIADRLLDRKHPGTFNQAMMELGATICLPRDPQCLICPVSKFCEARQNGTQNELPVKAVRPETIALNRELLLIRDSGRFLFWQRDQRFWELPEPAHTPKAKLGQKIGSFRHSIMNFRYQFSVHEASLTHVPAGLHWLVPNGIKYLFSTTTRKALLLSGVDFRG